MRTASHHPLCVPIPLSSTSCCSVFPWPPFPSCPPSTPCTAVLWYFVPFPATLWPRQLSAPSGDYSGEGARTECRAARRVSLWLCAPPGSRTIQRQSFHFDTEDTGPAYTQMQIQHRSRAPGPPYNSRTRSAAGPSRNAYLHRKGSRPGRGLGPSLTSLTIVHAGPLLLVAATARITRRRISTQTMPSGARARTRSPSTPATTQPSRRTSPQLAPSLASRTMVA